MASPLLLPLLNWARKLRFPTLFKIAAVLFAVTLIVPDPIPLVDEILLGLGALLLANWKDRHATIDHEGPSTGSKPGR